MRIQWEAQDIISGRRVCIPEKKLTWIIGYSQLEEGLGNRALICESDGCVIQARSSSIEIAGYLTGKNYWPIELLEKSKKSEAAK